MSNPHEAAPLAHVRFLSRGTIAALVLIAVALAVGAWRFVFGIGAISNLTDIHPWGIWIGIDVATGVALAAGGFTTSALVHIFHRERFHALVRPALLTAMLGYTFVSIGLLFDLGRYYNIWHPMIYWQGNSVLFEVGLCVMAYLSVLYLEFFPVFAERFKNGFAFPAPFARFNAPATTLLRLSERLVAKLLWIFIILGVVLSCLHQSSLGTLMLIAPSKLHPLWYTPIQPLLFLLSAIAVGYPMVIFEGLLAAKSFRLKPEMELFEPLSRFIIFFLGLYAFAKLVDLTERDMLFKVFSFGTLSAFWAVEYLLGVILPLILLMFAAVRRDPAKLLFTVTLIVLGVALNRINVFLVGYGPPFAHDAYVPALGEILITAGLIATLVLCYRFVALNFPVIAGEPKGGRHA